MIQLDAHLTWLIAGGVALLAMTTLPARFADRPLSLPIVYVAAGFAVFSLVPAMRGLDPIGSTQDSTLIEYATELIVIISLASAGLKLDRAIGFVSWASVWRLLSITMVLTVGVAVAAGLGWLGLGAAGAVLLGAVLAPTDPVLADDVQIDEPGDDVENEVRFTLTAEAGLNDGLAFPISWLAVALVGGSFGSVALDWVLIDVVVRIAIGLVSGIVLGRLLVRFSERIHASGATATIGGVFVLGATIVVYGITELLHGYGFLAVFVAALSRGSDEVRRSVSAFADELERILLAFVLLGFGGLVSAGILSALTWQGAVLAAVLVMVVRPLAGWIGLLGCSLPARERFAIAFFGIRGMGSLFYLAWAANEAEFPVGDLEQVWAITSMVVLVSIAVHGITAGPIMKRVERGAVSTGGSAPRRSADDARRGDAGASIGASDRS